MSKFEDWADNSDWDGSDGDNFMDRTFTEYYENITNTSKKDSHIILVIEKHQKFLREYKAWLIKKVTTYHCVTCGITRKTKSAIIDHRTETGHTIERIRRVMR